MSHGDRDPFRDAVSRRTFIKGAGAVAVLGGSLYATAPAAAQAQEGGTGRHAAQQPGHLVRREPVVRPLLRLRAAGASGRLRAAPRLLAAGRGRQPARAVRVHGLQTPDPPHDWGAVHEQWNGGAMDGFYKSSRRRSATATRRSATTRRTELPFYYSLLDDSALVGNFFCSLLGPTWPNRFYFAAGTSGGITTNGIWGYGVFDYPIILDLLDAAGVTWKVYNLELGQRPVRQHRQRLRLLGEVRARQAHAREQGRRS